MKYLYGTITLAACLSIFSCATKDNNSTTSTADPDEWPEMDAFHMTLAEAFHPLKDSGNVEPAMRLMGQLADEADKWVAASLPEKVNNEKVKLMLDKLRTDVRSLSNEINNGAPEDKVGTTLHTIHDQFHEIMEAWHGGKEHEQEEKH